MKKLRGDEVHAILELKESFDQSIQEVWQALDVCDDDCPNLTSQNVYTKFLLIMKVIPPLALMSHNVYVKEISVDRQGHPLVCSNDGGCRSKIRILRDVATHYPLLSKLLHLVYSAVNSHKWGSWKSRTWTRTRTRTCS